MKKSVLKNLLAFVRPYRGYLIVSLFSAVISIALTLLGPVLVGDAIDFIVDQHHVDFPSIARILMILCVSIGVGAIFQWILTLCTNKVAYCTVRDIRIQAFEKINVAPLRYIDGNAHGDLINRLVNDIDFIADGLLQGLTQLFTGVVTIVGTLLFMLSVNPWITIVVVLVTPLSLFVVSFIAKRSHKMFQEQSKTQGELGGYIEEMLGNQKVVKTFSHEAEAQKEFEGINGRLYQCGQKASSIPPSPIPAPVLSTASYTRR